MNEFAARTMLKIIEEGVRSLKLKDIQLPNQEFPSATIEKGLKTDLLTDIMYKHGLSIVFRLAEGVNNITNDPLKIALLSALDPTDLLDRWSRMQTHVHSHHRVIWQPLNNNEVSLQHISLSDKPPKVPETCMVFAVIIRLMELLETKDISLKSDDNHVTYTKGRWHITQPPTPECLWSLKYKAGERREFNTSNNELVSSKIEALIDADPCNRWNIQTAASLLFISARTLQRKLKSENKSFQRILSERRALIASQMIANQKMSMTEVGFYCGYASNTHFSNSFLKETAFTPSEYKKQFF